MYQSQLDWTDQTHLQLICHPSTTKTSRLDIVAHSKRRQVVARIDNAWYLPTCTLNHFRPLRHPKPLHVPIPAGLVGPDPFAADFRRQLLILSLFPSCSHEGKRKNLIYRLDTTDCTSMYCTGVGYHKISTLRSCTPRSNREVVNFF